MKVIALIGNDDIFELVGRIRKRRREVISTGSDERTFYKTIAVCSLSVLAPFVSDSNENLPVRLFPLYMQLEITITHAGGAHLFFNDISVNVDFLHYSDIKRSLHEFAMNYYLHL